MAIHDIEVESIDGGRVRLDTYAGKTMLIVNVASKCGFTPQYNGLQSLQDRYSEQGLVVLGFPCNQFGGQEPGTEEEIKEFCSLNFGVTFPLFKKVDVNGQDRHPLYSELTEQADAGGKAGDIGWNFEKFVVGPDGDVVARFRTQVPPDDEQLVSSIESHLPD